MSKLYISKDKADEILRINHSLFPVLAVANDLSIDGCMLIFVTATSFAKALKYLSEDIYGHVNPDYDVLIAIQTRDYDDLQELCELAANKPIHNFKVRDWRTRNV